jgi:hypothetical protein
MKNLIIFLFGVCFFQTYGQTQAEYDNAMARFMKFYNANQADSICNLFSDTWGEHKKTLWTSQDLMETKREYGEMTSFKYMGVEPGDSIRLYKTVCTKKTFGTGISLDTDNKMLTHRFHTTSPYIKKLLRKTK